MYVGYAKGLVLVLVLIAAPRASAVTVTFEKLTGAGSASDMSPDGRFIVGVGTFDEESGSYIWDTVLDTITVLPGPGGSAAAVSDDGTVVLGSMPDPDDPASEVAAMWTAASGWQSLGYLPNAGACPSRSNGYELSADGSVAVGLSWDGCSGRGFRWTEATGMTELANLANGGNRASVVSADGSVIAGFAQGSSSRTPATWGAGGSGQLMGLVTDQGEVLGMIEDGSVLVGTMYTGSGGALSAVKWSNPGVSGWTVETIGAGSIIGGWAGNAMDMADDGTVVGFDALLGNRRAWIQPGGTGPLVDLRSWVLANGGLVPAGFNLEVPQAISNDGRYIIGHGLLGAWRIIIQPDALSCTDWAEIEAAGCMTGPAGGPLPSGCTLFDADADGDGDLEDFAALQRSCPAVP
jgi:predicted regulator of Ras-like GTPase activity (Roadblock/LC7/MglB family)